MAAHANFKLTLRGNTSDIKPTGFADRCRHSRKFSLRFLLSRLWQPDIANIFGFSLLIALKWSQTRRQQLGQLRMALTKVFCHFINGTSERLIRWFWPTFRIVDEFLCQVTKWLFFRYLCLLYRYTPSRVKWARASTRRRQTRTDLADVTYDNPLAKPGIPRILFELLSNWLACDVLVCGFLCGGLNIASIVRPRVVASFMRRIRAIFFCESKRVDFALHFNI
jgi:hypothetical protein